MDYEIIDSQVSLTEALAGKDIPTKIKETLRIVNVTYFSFDKKLHGGQLVVHKDLQREVSWLFAKLLGIGFKIGQVVPVAVFGWDDQVSMQANNSSAFNIRQIAGTSPARYSQHSYGWALDLNPMLNPCYDYRTGTIEPKGCSYDPSVPGTLSEDSPAVKIFKDAGWVWGGDWTSLHDLMHFEKRLDGKLS